MNLLHLAHHNLWRRRSRSALTILGLAGSVAVVVSLVGLADALEESFLALYLRQGIDLVVQRRGGTVQLSKGMPLALGQRMRRLPNVEQVIAGMMDMVTFPDRGLFLVLVNGWEADSPVLDRIKVLSGRRLQPGDGRRVMLGRILAANLDKRPGDTVELYGQPFEVVGLFESFSIYENGAVYLLIDEMQRQLSRPGQASGFVVVVTPRGDRQVVEQVRARIEALDPSIEATPTVQFVRSLKQIQVVRAMAWTASAVALAIGVLGMLNTMAMAVLERRQEIGTLRAIGWRKSRVVRLIVTESLLLAVSAAAAGTALGLALLAALSRWHVTCGLFHGDWSPAAIGYGVGLAFLIALAGSLFPAWHGASQSPIESLHAR